MDINFYLNEIIINEICQKQVKKEPNTSSQTEPKAKSEAYDNADLEQLKQKFILQKGQFTAFDKKNTGFTISTMQSKSKHIVKNKLSDKLSRRDVQYYDLYHLQEPKEDYQQFKCEGGYPYTSYEAKIKELYGDLAYQDFNSIFKSHGDVVEKQYGQTLKINLSITAKKEGRLSLKREVKENLALRKNEMEMMMSKKRTSTHKDDTELQVLDQNLKKMAMEFGKTRMEIADIFCKVSGRISQVRAYLAYDKSQREALN